MKKPKIIKILEKVPRDHWGLAAAFLLIIGAIGYSAWIEHQRNEILLAQIAVLQEELDITSRILQESISETHASLASELETERAKAAALSQQIGNVQGAVGTLSGSVDDLEKLSETDPELLAKYSKVYFLSEHYTPPKLASIDPFYLYYETRPESIDDRVWPHLKDMLEAAHAQGEKLWVISGYRSFNEQANLKAAYTVQYGEGANTFSADQGYSEHQLGTSIDFITSGLGGQLEGFENTTTYQWLQNNAWKYGFILSYPQNNGYYIFEPWHWRFVGVELATLLKNTGRNFYDLDQRDIDTYLLTIFD